MNKKDSSYSLLVLVGLMCLGGWLALGSSGTRFFTGFILVISSFAGFIFLMRRENTRPLSRREAEAWGRVKEGGKSNYIRKAFVKGLLMGMVSSAVAVFSLNKGRSFGAYDLALFAALVLVVTFVVSYMSVRVWELNEKRSKKL
jgi:hypothetical protein